MSLLAYVNGAFVPEAEAKVSIFDRGFLFGDGVYEVTPVVDGQLADRRSHMARLARSLKELRLEPPIPVEDIDALQEEIIRRNNITEGRVYLQVSRGAAERDFAFPSHPEPSLVLFARQVPVIDTPAARKGLKVKTVPDTRWARRDIKTVMLLPASLAKQQAKDAGFDDAWFVQDGTITEATSSTAYIVKDGAVHTRPLSQDILPGCTRQALLQLIDETGIELKERLFGVDEAYAADEAFITSATTFVTPVVQIDDHVLGDGTPGPVAKRLREIYIEYAKGGE